MKKGPNLVKRPGRGRSGIVGKSPSLSLCYQEPAQAPSGLLPATSCGLHWPLVRAPVRKILTSSFLEIRTALSIKNNTHPYTHTLGGLTQHSKSPQKDLSGHRRFHPEHWNSDSRELRWAVAGNLKNRQLFVFLPQGSSYHVKGRILTLCVYNRNNDHHYQPVPHTPKKERFVHVRGIKSRKAFLGGSEDPVSGLLDLGYTMLSEAHTAEAKAWPPRATSKFPVFNRNKHMGVSSIIEALCFSGQEQSSGFRQGPYWQK